MFWKSLIGALTIGSATTLSVIPTATAIATHSIKNIKFISDPKSFDVSFKEIIKFDVINIDLLSPIVKMYLYSNDVIGSTGLPSDFYGKDGFAYIDIPNAVVFNQFGNIYNFNRNSTESEIKQKLSTVSVIDVSATIQQQVSPYDYQFTFSSFSCKLI